MTQPTHLYTKCNGLNFRPKEAREAFAALKKDEAVDLVPEPTNPYDRHAVMIVRRGTNLVERDAHSHFGYVPKELAPRVGEAIRDPNKQVSACKGSNTQNAVIITIEDLEEEYVHALDFGQDESFSETARLDGEYGKDE